MSRATGETEYCPYCFEEINKEGYCVNKFCPDNFYPTDSITRLLADELALSRQKLIVLNKKISLLDELHQKDLEFLRKEMEDGIRSE